MPLVTIATAAAVIVAVAVIVGRGNTYSGTGKGTTGNIAAITITDNGTGQSADHGTDDRVLAGIIAITVVIALGGGGRGQKGQGKSRGDCSDADLRQGLHVRAPFRAGV